MPHYKLTYLDLNARGEPIRMIFALAGVQFEDVRLPLATWKDHLKDTPFLALPMLEVDGVKIAQTLAILRFLAKEFGFAGPDNLTCAIADALADQYADFVMSWMEWHMVNRGYKEGGDKNELYENLFKPMRAKHLPFFEAALRKSSSGWFANTPDVTHADIFIASSIEYLLKVLPDPSSFFDGFPLLHAHYKKFFVHPKLQKHLSERPDVDY